MLRPLLMMALPLAAALGAATSAPAQELVLVDGKPNTQSCLISRQISQSQPGIDRKWYVRTRDGRWWRNQMDCAMLTPGRALVHTTPIGNQCRGDMVQVVDFMAGGINFGGCAFLDWEQVDKPAPTRRPRADKDE